MFKSSELAVKSAYLVSIKYKTNWYWGPENDQKNLIVSTHTILHPYTYVSEIKDVADIPIIVYNSNKAQDSLPRCTNVSLIHIMIIY